MALDAQLFHLGGDTLSALQAEVVDDDAARVCLREAKRDRASDALSSTGYQADAALEIKNVNAQAFSSK